MTSRLILLLSVAVLLASADLVPGNGVIQLFYTTQWAAPHIHYNNGTAWTVPPGPLMSVSNNNTLGNWMITIAANKLTFVMNDGNGNWDNNGGKNYVAPQPGVFTLKNAVVTTLESFEVGCPDDCNDNGVCQQSTYTCNCNAGYYGAGCTCRPQDCGNNGACDAGGNCICQAPFATCPSSTVPCGVDLSEDPNNCGACGNVCGGSRTGVDSASCASSACVVTCIQGYSLCKKDDGQPFCFLGTTCPIPPLPGCEIFSENQCSGDVIVTDDKYAKNRWYTPRPGDDDYKPSFGDYWRLVGHSHMEYDSSLSSATVTLVAEHKDGNAITFTYQFNGVNQTSPTKTFTSTDASPATAVIFGSDGSMLKLQDIDFRWAAPVVARTDGDFRGGQKGAIVELFGWPHKDIEEECADMASMGWAGVKVFPMHEQVMSQQPFNNDLNPWFFMYQPVSYRFEGRMGTHEDLRNMIYTCRKYGVRVYADAVINHMVGSGNDMNPHHRHSSGSCVYWPNKNSSAQDMSPFYTQGFIYTYNDHTGQFPLQEFPAVPYGPLDFHCERALNAWNSALILNAGWLVGLVDINTERPNVQERIADYLTSLLSIGFSGFRIDAAKHMHPDDLVAIFSNLKRNMGGQLPPDFITWWEVLVGGEGDMLLCDENSGYNYGKYLEKKFLSSGFSATDVQKIKIWNCGYPNQPGQDCGAIDRKRNTIQNDDADQQTPGSTSRDMGGAGSILIKDKNPDLHRQFEIQLFKNPNGMDDNDNDAPIRMVLSSYYWGDNGSLGVPDGKSDCSLCQYTCAGCQTMEFMKAHDPNSCGYDSPRYTRVHRDKQIIAAMRSWMKMSASTENNFGLPSHC